MRLFLTSLILSFSGFVHAKTQINNCSSISYEQIVSLFDGEAQSIDTTLFSYMNENVRRKAKEALRELRMNLKEIKKVEEAEIRNKSLCFTSLPIARWYSENKQVTKYFLYYGRFDRSQRNLDKGSFFTSGSIQGNTVIGSGNVRYMAESQIENPSVFLTRVLNRSLVESGIGYELDELFSKDSKGYGQSSIIKAKVLERLATAGELGVVPLEGSSNADYFLVSWLKKLTSSGVNSRTTAGMVVVKILKSSPQKVFLSEILSGNFFEL